MMKRRFFALGAGAMFVTGCQASSVQPAKVVGQSHNTARSTAQAAQMDMTVVDVSVAFGSEFDRKSELAGVSRAQVERSIDSIFTQTLGAANPAGTRRARADITVFELLVAGGASGSANTILFGAVKFHDVATGAEIGRARQLPSRAAFRATGFGGGAFVQAPREELASVVFYSARELAERIYGA